MALANFSRLSSALKMLPAKKGYNWALIIYARFELSRKNQSINCLILNELTHASLSYPILFPSFFCRPLAKSELSPSFILLLPSILLPFFSYYFYFPATTWHWKSYPRQFFSLFLFLSHPPVPRNSNPSEWWVNFENANLTRVFFAARFMGPPETTIVCWRFAKKG